MTSMDQPGRRPRFTTRAEPTVTAEDPERLFGSLPRTANGVKVLWAHQADQLRHYARDHRGSADVALELPTGSGKTLVGLLIAEWRRRTLNQRVVYACPTKQLARQVFKKAQEQGIPVVLLIGTSRDWPPADVARYVRGAAIAITVYSAIFNSRSHLADAQTLLFDDAHAAEGYVAEAWAVQINRRDSAYSLVLDALGDDIDQQFVVRMSAADGPAADGGEVRLLPVRAIARRADALDTVLGSLSDDSGYRYRMIRSSLTACLFYVARSGIYIRPMIPPTFQHVAFTGPVQRIYLSATLGDAGELERSFGRSSIKRVPVPPEWERTGSGRRFFVFPDMAEPGAKSLAAAALFAADHPDAELASETEDAADSSPMTRILDLADKRLLLTPDDNSASKIADELHVPEADRYTAKNAETGIEPFLQAKHGTLLAPNRYDGMDLADEGCRMMLMSGLPTASHLQDRFLGSKLRAAEVLHEQILTRVVQGAGRCTRGPQDWSVVVIQGDDLIRFLSQREVRAALPAELQAEIEFGMAVSETSADNLVMLAESALTQDEIWQEDAEPDLSRRRLAATRTPAANNEALAASASREVTAWTAAWVQDWEGAARAAVGVLEHLTAPALRPYQALWAYLGSAWSTLASTDSADAAAQRADLLLRRAHAAAEGTTWLKEVQPLPEQIGVLDLLDDEAVSRVLATLAGTLYPLTKFTAHTTGMIAGLNQKKAPPYEQALVALGSLLGAESSKPAGQARADAVWLWSSWWVTLEAKSDQNEAGKLSVDYVRQANAQLAALAGDQGREEPPPDSVSVIVSPRTLVEPDAVPLAHHNLHLVGPDLMLDLAHDAIRAWKELRGLAVPVTTTAGAAYRSAVATILWQHRVLPTQIRERLTVDPIRRR